MRLSRSSGTSWGLEQGEEEGPTKQPASSRQVRVALEALRKQAPSLWGLTIRLMI